MTTTATPTLTMDDQHVYRLGDVVLPSVTQVIGSVLPGWQADPWYLERGSALHHGCRLFDEGRLDWSSVAPEIEGRVRAWEQFRKDWPAKMLACEMPMVHSIYNYAGTLDRVFQSEAGLTLLDIKSSIAPQVALQLGAYSQLWNEVGAGTISRGAAVELRDNGTYSAEWFTKREVEQGGRIFLACLTIHSFKKKHNLT